MGCGVEALGRSWAGGVTGGWCELLVCEWWRWRHTMETLAETMETMELGLPLVQTIQVTGHWPHRHPHTGHTRTQIITITLNTVTTRQIMHT